MRENNTTEFILERIHLGWQINVWLCDVDGTILTSAVEQYESGYNQIPDQPLIEQVYAKCQTASYPIIFMEEDMVYYLAFLDDKQQLYLMGPIATENLGFSQHHAYRQRHGITEKNYRIPYISPIRALTCLSLACFMVTGRMVDEKTLMQENEAMEKLKEHEYAIYQLQQDSEENRRFSYRNEQKWLAQIENGTLQEQQIKIDRKSQQKLEKVGHLALNNSFKQYEYMVISQICLASRAAMRGGMNTFEAYTLSDMYYQKVSQCNDVMELLNICLQVEQDFSQRVRAAKQQGQDENYIEQCKNYIARHRTKKFTINEMAQDLGLSRSYLSRQFSRQMGITIQEYIIRQRLEAAANMLRFSEEQIGTISDYLCFNSQSYFTERFRKQYGMTPNEYRHQNKVIDFHSLENGDINDKKGT